MIVIPMAGLSKRFTAAGYTLPKYMLEASGKFLFDHAVESFKSYFLTEHFLFVCRDVSGTPKFVEAACRRLGIRSFECVVLDQETDGQAHTVLLGMERAKASDDVELTIFNIDTFRPGLVLPEIDADGYLEVFEGSGSNWSYVRPWDSNSNRVIETAEKVQISNLCCTGLYNFSKFGNFRASYENWIAKAEVSSEKKEVYVAPLYNFLIDNLGLDIRFNLIKKSDVIFCGVPSEYEDFLKSLRN